MQYYLDTYLNGMNQYEAYEFFEGMDQVVYVTAKSIFKEADLDKWRIERIETPADADGVTHYAEIISTPGGKLTHQFASNRFTTWTTEYLIKTERDWELADRYIPVPCGCDQSAIIEARNRIGEKGIVRGLYFGFGQGSPWQDLCCLMDTQQAIYAACDNPQWIHAMLESILQKRLRFWNVAGKLECDLLETGGGAGSSTVISPNMHSEFCLPYDIRQHSAVKSISPVKIVYHLCGGLMPLLNIVTKNGADGLETMTPPSMGGDCDLKKASAQIGDKMFFVGGFDQNAGFERGTPQVVKKLVRECFEATKDNAGYICSPSDHFFKGDVENIKTFARECSECRY